MPASALIDDAPPSSPLTDLADRLVVDGWAVLPDFLSRSQWTVLATETRARFDAGAFRHARVGRGESLRLRPEVRTDRVLWLDPAQATPAERVYLDRIEELRLAINERLFLGLFSLEAHFAVFPAGTFYRRHSDRFRGSEHRLVTCIVYLNDAWTEDDGGRLRIYTGGPDRAGQPDEPFVDVAPEGGTLACFLSERFEHEVLPASRERASITGWLCRRSAPV